MNSALLMSRTHLSVSEGWETRTFTVWGNLMMMRLPESQHHYLARQHAKQSLRAVPDCFLIPTKHGCWWWLRFYTQQACRRAWFINWDSWDRHLRCWLVGSIAVIHGDGGVWCWHANLSHVGPLDRGGSQEWERMWECAWVSTRVLQTLG